MKFSGSRTFLSLSILTLFAFAAVANTPSSAVKEKITTQELIEKHLNSIGPAEALKSVKSIMAVGESKAIFKGRGSGLTDGIVVMASQGKRNMIGMKFRNPDHQFDTMGYDGNNFSVGFAKPGTRSVLGGFLRVNEKTFKKGILGGVLSTSWELLNYDSKIGKLKYKGTSKDDGKTLYKFDYNLRSGSDLEVMMYFDSETFQHVKTIYTRVFSSGMGSTSGINQGASRVDNSARQSETRHKFTETFSDFRVESGLTLPHTYEMFLEIQTGNGNTKDHYTMQFTQFVFNQEMADSQFQMGG